MVSISRPPRYKIPYPYPENFYLDVPRTGDRIKASWLFSDVKIGCYIATAFTMSIINFVICRQVKSRINRNTELQIIVSFNRPENAQEIYKERWQIETAFRALCQATKIILHLRDIERVDKLFALVIVAFTWAYIVGFMSTKT
ncbi:hypothetical protein MASR1M31_08690 [Porphyromonadaceae bacterium]